MFYTFSHRREGARMETSAGEDCEGGGTSRQGDDGNRHPTGLPRR